MRSFHSGQVWCLRFLTRGWHSLGPAQSPYNIRKSQTFICPWQSKVVRQYIIRTHQHHPPTQNTIHPPAQISESCGGDTLLPRRFQHAYGTRILIPGVPQGPPCCFWVNSSSLRRSPALRRPYDSQTGARKRKPKSIPFAAPNMDLRI